MKLSDKHRLFIIFTICVVYVLLRLWNLTDSCLWFDEIFSIHAAEHDWKNLFWFVAQDLIHPPLFYVLLKIWIIVGGESLFWLRFFPVFFSIIAVIPFVLLGRQLKLSPSTVAVALAFFAVNGSCIKYSQEVRMYSLLLCLALFSLWLFVRFLNTDEGFWLLVFVNIALVYSHYFGWLIITSEVLAVVLLTREKLKRILLMSLIALSSFAPWLYAIWQASKINADVGQNIGWMAKPNILAVFRFAFDLFEPIYFEQSTKDSSAIFLITLPIIAINMIALVFYCVDWKAQSAAEKRDLCLLLIFIFTPILLAFAASWILPYSVWGTRHLIVAFAPFVMLLAVIFSKIKFRQLRTAGLSAVLLLCAAALLVQAVRPEPKYIWCAWENLAENLDKSQPTKIYVFEDLVAYHFWFALRESDANLQIIKINGIEGLIEDKAYFLPRDFDKIQKTKEFSGEQFFIVFRDKIFNEFAPPLQNLTVQRYKIGEPQIYEAQGLKAFLVEVKKQ